MKKGEVTKIRADIFRWKTTVRVLPPVVMACFCLLLVFSGGCLDILGNPTNDSEEGAVQTLHNSSVPVVSPSFSPGSSAGKPLTTPAVTEPVETSSVLVMILKDTDGMDEVGDIE